MDRLIIDGENLRELKAPAYIEAKKAKLEKINNNGEIKTVNKYNYYDCKEDITKLINEMEYIEKHKNIYDCIHSHLLIWDNTNNSQKDNPKKVEKYLKQKIGEEHSNYDINIHQIRWFPLNSISELNISINHKIKRWGWVALMEIEKI